MRKKIIGLGLLICLALTLFSASVASAETLTFYSVADGYKYTRCSTSYSWTDTVLEARYQDDLEGCGDRAVSVFKFNVTIPTGVAIKSKIVKLYGCPNDDMYINTVPDFSEGGTGIPYWIYSGIVFNSSNYSGGWTSIDVTSKNTYAFGVCPVDRSDYENHSFYFSSREGSNPPQLIITYIPVPSNLRASSIGHTSVNLVWDGSSTETPVYEVYKNGVLYGQTTAKTMTITGLSPATTYSFKVRAKDGTEYTAFSDTISVTTTPATPSTPTGTVGGVSWSNNPNNPGRSYVTLSWAPVTGATGYKVYMFDGYQYRMVQDVGNKTTWDSRTARIFPAESVLDSKTDNTVTTNLFVTPTTGYDLPDRPTKLYKKTSGTAYDSHTNYWFRVTAYNASGESPQSDAFMPTLPDRTDTEAPTGSLVINDGAYNTANREVTLDISGSDTESGIAQMQFSNDNISWSAWESYTTSKAWQIGAGIGQQQTVYMRLKDNAGNISNIISASVFFASDAMPPVIKVSINNGAKQTDSNKVTVYVEASDDFSTIDHISMRVSTNGTDWWHLEGDSWVSGWGTYRYANANFDLGSSGGNKPVFVQAKDAAGNIANATASIYYVTPDTLPSSTVTMPTANATWGVNLNGSYVSVNGEVMQVIQGNSVAVNLTGLTNAADIITSFDGISWSQPDRIPVGLSSITKDVTWPDEGKKTLYLKVRNDAGVESPIIIRRYLVDYTAPVIEVRTASGATMTSGSNIDLIVKARDNVSTALAYRINGGTWNTLPSNGIISAPVAGGQGLKRITVEVVDETGNVVQEVVNIWKA